MAGSSLFALIDDITSILDDVATMTKVATQKTAGVLGDDLALNAQQVSGIAADRELPVVWAVAKGSFVNKLILVPAALAISALAAFLITPLLMIGGAYLCFEGAEKLVHKFLHAKAEDDAHHAELVEALVDPATDMLAFERDKIKGAVRTDFVLSAEIIVIALGTTVGATFIEQCAVLAGIAILMTVGVYGLVGCIVKMDDLGLHLSSSGQAAGRAIGRGLLLAAPRLMQFLSVAGTIAMFLVGGGILTHGIPGAHDLLHAFEHLLGALPGIGGVAAVLGSFLFDGLAGLLAGLLIVLLVTAVGKLRGAGSAAH